MITIQVGGGGNDPWGIPWQAWAAFAAVAAAILVGIGQLTIASRQSSIAKFQSRLVEQDLKFKLFTARSKYIELFQRYLSDIRVNKQSKGFSEIEMEFIRETKIARFLFPIQMDVLIEEVYDLAGQYEEASDDLHVSDQTTVHAARTQRALVRRKLDDAATKLLELAEAELRIARP